MNRKSLTFRLLSWYCVLLVLLGIAFAAYTYVSFDQFTAATTYSQLVHRSSVIGSFIESTIDDPAELKATIQKLVDPENQNRFMRVSLNGKVIYSSGPPEDHSFDPAKIPLPASGAVNFVRLDGLNLYNYSRSFALPDGRVVTLEAGVSDEPIDELENRLIGPLLVGLPLLLMFAVGGGYVLIQRALGSVEAMIRAAEALTFNSPHNRLPLAGTGDRIDALGRTLNRMLERLDNAYQHASRFSADAAHELRTPLSIVRGELELLASERNLPIDLQTALGNILDETARLSQIVENLIALSRLESIGGKRAHEPVDLVALAAETIEQMHLLADEKGIPLEAPAGPPVFTAGDRDRLKQVLVNLLDNAIKYTQPGGHIAVTVSAAAGGAVITVKDNGIGIAPEHASLIFERFYRVATDRGEVGSGLGLAIARSICSAHGGRIDVSGSLGEGSAFRVELPLLVSDGAGSNRNPSNSMPIAPISRNLEITARSKLA